MYFILTSFSARPGAYSFKVLAAEQQKMLNDIHILDQKYILYVHKLTII